MIDNRTFWERSSDKVAEVAGSWRFILIFSAVMVVWITLNTISLFKVIAWDEPPFILLNLVLSFIAAFQAPFIMMSQNRAEAKQDEAYRQLFYEIKDLVQVGNEHAINNKQDLRSIREELKFIKAKIKEQDGKNL